MIQKENIKQLIDNDEGLKSKKRLLVITSLIMLAIQFSGAKVVEANTFILKLEFTHQVGIPFLLVISICFLMVRYYNYAGKYHDKLYELWSGCLLEDDLYYVYNPYTDDHDGFVYGLMPNNFNHQQLDYEEHSSWSISYVRKLFFRRYLRYSSYDGDQYKHVNVALFSRVSFKKYLVMLWLESAYRNKGLLTQREHLDILSPYILGVVAILSYFCNGLIIQIMNTLAI